jgi:hypothetical protein
MRRIPLKTVELADATGSQTRPLLYSEAVILLAKAPQGGLNAAEMDLALAIEASVEAAQAKENAWVLLEEAEWTWLCERFRTNRFPYASPVFRELIAAVLEAEKYDPNAERDMTPRIATAH